MMDEVSLKDSGQEKYWYWLCNIKGIGRKRIGSLVDYFGSPSEVFKAKKSQLIKVQMINEKEAGCIINSKKNWDVQEKYWHLNDLNVRFLSIWHADYPVKLKNIEDYPFGIYVRGNLPEESRPSVAIVGARMCSSYGRKTAEEISRILCEYDVQIISGLAMGIDGIGQKAAVDAGGRTFGILGCGVDICYPKQNIDLYMRMQQRGGLISEFNVGTEPMASHFPMRNRIISGLSDIVIVVEAKEKSGSLITADMALEQGKDVLAVPGRINDSLSKGCNYLIKQGGGMILSPEDLVNELGLNSEKILKNFKKNKIGLESEQKVLYSCLDFQPKNLQTILSETGLPIENVIEGLFALVLRGYIEETAQNYYIKRI